MSEEVSHGNPEGDRPRETGTHIDLAQMGRLIANDWVKPRTHTSKPYTVVDYINIKTERAFDDGLITPDDKALIDISRGLVYNNETGEVIIRPFPRFTEVADVDTQDLAPGSFIVQDKLDGTLVTQRNLGDETIVATRGALEDSERIDRATAFIDQFKQHDGGLLGRPDVTYLWELVGPDNKLIVDYPEDKLVLLAMIDTATGDTIPLPHQDDLPDDAPFELVQSYPELQTLDDVRAAVNERPGTEGFVIVRNDGKRYRIKSDEYLADKQIFDHERRTTRHITDIHEFLDVFTDAEAEDEGIDTVDRDTLAVLLQKGYITVGEHSSGELFIANSTGLGRHMHDTLTAAEKQSLDLAQNVIFDRTGKIIARALPPAKPLEDRELTPNSFTVQDRLDGSPCVQYTFNGEQHIATDGVFEDPVGKVILARKLVRDGLADTRNQDVLTEEGVTNTWQLVGPSVPNIIDYDTNSMVLTGRVETATGRMLPLPQPDEISFPVVQEFPGSTTTEQVREQVNQRPDTAGLVAITDDGERFYIESKDFAAERKKRDEKPYRRLWHQLQEGKTIDRIRAETPPDLRDELEVAYRQYLDLRESIIRTATIHNDIAKEDLGENYSNNELFDAYLQSHPSTKPYHNILLQLQRYRKFGAKKRDNNAILSLIKPEDESNGKRGGRGRRRPDRRSVREQPEQETPLVEQTIPEVAEEAEAPALMERVDLAVMQGLIDRRLVKARRSDNLTVADYFERRLRTVPLTVEERNLLSQIRGVIYNNETGEIVSRPFPRFRDLESDDNLPEGNVTVTDKIDGTLGIMYWKDGEPRLATRSSFEDSIDRNTGEMRTRLSDANTLLTEYTRQLGGSFSFNPDYTYLWEIVDPDYKHVVDYGDQKKIVLLGIVDTQTGRNMPLPNPEDVPFEVIQPLPVNTTEELHSLVEGRPNTEGVVILDNTTGRRSRMKSQEYLWKYSIARGEVAEKLWTHMKNNGTIEDFVDQVPETARDAMAPLVETYARQYTDARTYVDQLADSVKNGVEERGWDYGSRFYVMKYIDDNPDARLYKEVLNALYRNESEEKVARLLRQRLVPPEELTHPRNTGQDQP